METNLYRTSSFYRPLFVDIGNKSFELDDIVFFNENGIIVNIGNGYFDDDKERSFNGSVVRKREVNFNNKFNYMIKSPQKSLYSDSGSKYILYVYEKNVELHNLGKAQKYFGDIHSHWEVNGYRFWKYERTLKTKLNELNDKGKKLIEEFFVDKCCNYKGLGVDEELLKQKCKELQSINKKILKEIENIKNYKID